MTERRRATLRERTITRLAYRRDEAAAALAISTTTFDVWVSQGLMPKPRRVAGVTLWDARAIEQAWMQIASPDEPQGSGNNPFDSVVA